MAADPTPIGLGVSTSCVTDEELVVRAQAGDTDAFDQLVVRHQAAVYRAAMAALRRAEDAEEVAQDAFVRAWVTLKTFRGEASFRTWMLSIAWRRALNRRRSLTRWWHRAEPETRLHVVAAPGNAPDEVMDCSELRRHIAGAIEALTPKLRDALLLARAGEYDYAEIGAMLGIPEGTVKWRVSEARRRIRERLVKVGYIHAR